MRKSTSKHYLMFPNTRTVKPPETNNCCSGRGREGKTLSLTLTDSKTNESKQHQRIGSGAVTRHSYTPDRVPTQVHTLPDLEAAAAR